MIDLHLHLLPGLDDGPGSPEEAVDLVRAAAAAGTPTLVATPHVDHRWGVDPEAVAPAVAALNRRLREEGVEATVLPGAEISVPRLLDLPAERLESLRLGGGPYALVEAPHTQAMGDFDTALIARLREGDRLVLAHPERCPTFQRHPDRLARLVEAGALTSVTAASLTGRFGRRVRDFTIRMFECGHVHSVASDAHDLVRRPPGLLAGLDVLDGVLPRAPGLADWLAEDVPRAVLTGGPVPPRPEPTRRPRSRARTALARLPWQESPHAPAGGR
jgi:protein-tyrosine phosphatase